MGTVHKIMVNGKETAQKFPRYKPLVPIRQVGSLVFVSGHGPEDINTYEPLFRGRVGDELTLLEGYDAARACADTLFRAVSERYGTLDCIQSMVKSYAQVNCGECFTQVEEVADGFSDFCIEVLQERGCHARTVMGTRNMPNHNIPVEIEMIFILKEGFVKKQEA